jgi:LysR family nitrogen assimilation transcriptional regulator
VDLQQLAYFVQVAEHGSFSRAAVEIAVGQPALSRQMRLLEEELGLTLFVRNGRGVILTEAGRLGLQHARNILDAVDRAKRELSLQHAHPSGDVVLAMTPTVGSVMSARLVREFRRAHPLVSVRLVEGFSGHILEWLLSRRVDVGVLYKPTQEARLVIEDLLVEELFLIGPAMGHQGYGRTVDLQGGEVEAHSLCDLPLILPGPPHGLRSLIEAVAAECGFELDVVLQIDTFPTIKELVADGLGYTLLPLVSVRREVASGLLRAARVVNPTIRRTVVLATATDRPLTAAARELANFVRSLSGDLMGAPPVA